MMTLKCIRMRPHEEIDAPHSGILHKYITSDFDKVDVLS